MSDPLGLIGSSGGVGGAGRAQPLAGQGTRAGSAQGDPQGPSFKDVLLQNIKQVNDLQQDATRAMEDYTAGRRPNIESVMLATQKADTAFRALQAVRNKVVAAYEEIKQMRV
jgi:flagellar hook-basal body complex protein FliE